MISIIMVQAISRGLEADPHSRRLRELRTETEGELTGVEIKAVLDALRTVEGNAPNSCLPERLFRVDVALRYPQVPCILRRQSLYNDTELQRYACP